MAIIVNEKIFIINGLAGERKLKGSISINGAKNAALQAFAFSLLFKDEVVLKNVPEIEDVKNMVTAKASANEIKKKAVSLGMRTLFDDGIQKVKGAITTIEEVLRVTEEI